MSLKERLERQIKCLQNGKEWFVILDKFDISIEISGYSIHPVFSSFSSVCIGFNSLKICYNIKVFNFDKFVAGINAEVDFHKIYPTILAERHFDFRFDGVENIPEKLANAIKEMGTQ